MHCPNCGHKQYCPCPNCVDTCPKDMKPWVWLKGDIINCGNCGFSQYADWWEEVTVAIYKWTQQAIKTPMVQNSALKQYNILSESAKINLDNLDDL